MKNNCLFISKDTDNGVYMQSYEIEMCDRGERFIFSHVGHPITCVVLCRQQIRERKLSAATIISITSSGQTRLYNCEEIKVRNIAAL